MKKFIIRLLELDKQIAELQSQIKELNDFQIRMLKTMHSAAETAVVQKDAINKIQSLIHIGVDVHDSRYQSSWCVVCLKGKENDRDIVNFFEVRFEDYKHLKKMLKQFDMFEKKAIDIPSGLGKDFFI